MFPRARFLPPFLVTGLLALLLWRSDLTALGQAFARISAGPVIAGLCLVQLQVILSALRWRFTAGRLGQVINAPRAIREYYVASLLNQSLPGGMGGDAIRAWRMRSLGAGGWKLPAKAIVYERLSGQAIFFLMLALGLPLWPLLIEGPSPVHVGWVVGGVCVAAGLLLAGIGWAARRGTVVSPGLKDVFRDAAEVFLHRGAWLVQAALSLVVVAAYAAVFLLSSHAIGATLPWQAALTIIPLCLLSMLIPVGLGGWGTREAAAMALWPLFGYSPSDGLAASLLYGALSLIGAAPGLIILVLEALGVDHHAK